ncbi:hypothetical protein IAU60_003430 [Kwoniella sp. DSM 27419]
MALDASLAPASDGPVSTEPKRTTKATHPNLPPGLILDAEGKVCKVCNSWADFARGRKRPSAGSAGGNKAVPAGMAGFASMMGGGAAAGSSSTPAGSGGTGQSDAEPVIAPVHDRKDCPPDNAQLGRSTWTFLHTTAAYYPLSAPPKAQENMTNLLSSLSLLYPCNWCATDFRRDMGRNPPDVSGREGLMKWLCERHNEVNRKLGKDEFGCDTSNLDRRWKDGPDDGSCD